MRKSFIVLLTLLSVMSVKVKADEGMWLLPLIDRLNVGTMTEMGLKLSAEDIYSINKACLKDAVVIFGGGCTGEIVSPEGLLLTNHHCGYGQIQSHSTVEHDYLANGFWAKTREEELPNPGLSVLFLTSIEDVTARVLSNVNSSMTEQQRSEAINSMRSKIVAETTKGSKSKATVTSFYGGNYFYLLVYDVYSDVRLVGAPPSSMGKYGNDADNWMWPRHTCDFSMFRVYMSPDGKPAEYSENNVPLKPKHYLPVSIKDLQKNDFTMVMGYPGTTTRYMTSYEVNEAMNITNKNRDKIRGEKQDIWLKDMQSSEKINIQYAAKYSSSSNYWKFSIGQNQGLTRLHSADKKAAFEAEFTKWVNADTARIRKYGNALSLIENAVKSRSELLNALQYYNECFRGGCELISFSNQFTALEDALKDGNAEKTKELADKLMKGSEMFYKNYNYPTDIKTTKAMFKLFRNDIDSKFYPEVFKVIDKKFKGDIDKYVDYLFAKSVFVTPEKLQAFLANPDLLKLRKDPAYVAALSITKNSTDLYSKIAAFNDNLARGQRQYIAGIMEFAPDKILYPDANFTMRLTYGKVEDYYPYDAVHYNWYTTMDGILQKYKPGDYDFDLPQRLIDLYNKKEFGRYAAPDGHMPACFITNNDITGGNSGSPVINANGELIGLAFDGNWEAMTGNIAFETDLQRCICVDIRYVLWVIDIYAGAGNLIKEMDIRQ
ncbi:MAG TPA: S46 family peptidase [Bacteroidales bacterium]|nr:S46 family peptidase [Bacteroidales bacterium]